jgi:hypothetical protein
MKVKELILALHKLEQDLEVYGYCDHGQSPEKIKSPSTFYMLNKDEFSPEDFSIGVSPEDAEELGYNHKAILL